MSFAAAEIGFALPPLDVQVTATKVAGGALAARDYTPVHHSRAAAQAQGLPDIFMSIQTTNGHIGRYVTDWAGANASIRGIKLKLGGPCMPGDTLKLRGKVVEKSGAELHVEVTGNNSWGEHVRALVRIAPAAAQQRGAQ